MGVGVTVVAGVTVTAGVTVPDAVFVGVAVPDGVVVGVAEFVLYDPVKMMLSSVTDEVPDTANGLGASFTHRSTALSTAEGRVSVPAVAVPVGRYTAVVAYVPLGGTRLDTRTNAAPDRE